jgi:isoquinoline 1-oxidoreductase alpha subunit
MRRRAVRRHVARAVQDAWRRLDVSQCGYCQSGRIMSAIALLSEIRRPADAHINAANDDELAPQ